MAVLGPGHGGGYDSEDKETDGGGSSSGSSSSGGMYSYETQLKSDIDESVAGQHDGGESVELNQSSEDLIKKRSRQIVQNRQDNETSSGGGPKDNQDRQTEPNLPSGTQPDPEGTQQAGASFSPTFVLPSEGEDQSGGGGGMGIIIAVIVGLAALAGGFALGDS